MGSVVNKFKWIISLMMLVNSNYMLAQPQSIGILGDSLATGAATHPNMTYDSKSLWDIFYGKQQVKADAHGGANLVEFGIDPVELPLVQPPKLWPELRRFQGGLDWVYFNLLDAFSTKYLNTEQYSWGYLLGRGLGIPPEQILIAAENGARSDRFKGQIDKILKYNNGQLPDKIFVMFNGNDLCSLNAEMTTTPGEYIRHYKEGIEYLIKHGKESSQGTEIVLVGFIGITQLMVRQEILDKKINFFGEQKSCREVRARGFVPEPDSLLRPGLPQEALYFVNMIPPNPSQICHTLFGKPKDVNEFVGVLAERVKQYRLEQKKLIEYFESIKHSKYNGRNLNFTYIDRTEKILFNPEEIGPDCFHLSLLGQKRVALEVLSELKNKEL